MKFKVGIIFKLYFNLISSIVTLTFTKSGYKYCSVLLILLVSCIPGGKVYLPFSDGKYFMSIISINWINLSCILWTEYSRSWQLALFNSWTIPFLEISKSENIYSSSPTFNLLPIFLTSSMCNPISFSDLNFSKFFSSSMILSFE